MKALITGATSGIGRDMAVLLAKQGIGDAVNYYRGRQTGKQKLKRLLLQASALIPDPLRAKLRNYLTKEGFMNGE